MLKAMHERMQENYNSFQSKFISVPPFYRSREFYLKLIFLIVVIFVESMTHDLKNANNIEFISCLHFSCNVFKYYLFLLNNLIFTKDHILYKGKA